MTLIRGRPGERVFGTNGDDELYVFGEARADGRNGNDFIFGDDARNHLVGGNGADWLDGGGGRDFLDGGNHDDVLFAGAGDDLAWGGNGNDYLGGQDGNDTLRGGAGNDILDGGRGDDVVDGGAGDDILIHEALDPVTPGGSDRFVGGSGYDQLQFRVTGEFDEFGTGPTDVFVRMNDRGGADVGYRYDPIESDVRLAGTATGIEEFRIVDFETELCFHGSDADVKAVGAGGNDFFRGGRGDEIFDGGVKTNFDTQNMDAFRFVFDARGMGTDRVLNFNAEEGDTLGIYHDPSMPPDLTYTQAEDLVSGTTTFTGYSAGNEVHTLIVDAIGLPPLSSYADEIG